MKKSFISFLLLAVVMLLITGCPFVKNKLPTVSKVSGPSGTISQSSSTFSWNGSDSDGTIESYEYKKDSSVWVSIGTDTSYVWNDYSEGPHTFEVRAKDNQGEYSEPVSWIFNFVQEEPLLLQIPDQTVNEGEELVIDLTGYTTSGNATDTLTYTLISGIGEILGNSYTYFPSYTDSGTKNVTIRVTDNKGRVDECSFQIIVNNVTAAIVRVYDMETGETILGYEASLMCENELVRTGSTETDILYLNIEGAERDSLEIKIAKSSFEVLQIPIESVIESEDVEFDIISLRLELSHAYVEQEGTYLIEKEIVLPSDVEKQIKYVSNIMNEYPVSDGTLLVSGYDDLVNCGFLLSEDGRIIGTWSDIPGYSGSSISETGAADVIDSLIIIGGMTAYGVIEKTPENCAAVLDFAKELKEYEDAIDVYLQNAVADDYDMLQDDELLTLVAKIIYELDQELGPLEGPATYDEQCVDCIDCQWRPYVEVIGSKNGDIVYEAVSDIPLYILVARRSGEPVVILPVASVKDYFFWQVSNGEIRFSDDPFDQFSDREFIYYVNDNGDFETENERKLAAWASMNNFCSAFILTLDEMLNCFLPIPANEIYKAIKGLSLGEMGETFIDEARESCGKSLIKDLMEGAFTSFRLMQKVSGALLSTAYSIHKNLGYDLSWSKVFFPKISSLAKNLVNVGKVVFKVLDAISSGMNIGWTLRYLGGADEPENGCCSMPLSQYPSFTDIQTPEEIYASVPAEMTATSDGDILEWDFDGNGQYDLSTNLRSVTWTYKNPGNYKLTAAAINIVQPVTQEFDKAYLKTYLSKNVTVLESSSNPVVTKVSGPDGEVSESSSTFTWTGSDPDGTITKYEYRKDEGGWVSNGTSTSYTWSGYSEGPHKFEVRAQDNDEQYSEAVEWNFTYSTGTVIVGEMVLVEGGTFMMGDTWGDGRQNELPVHEVTLTYDFFVGKYEVTFEEYDAFCDATGKSKPSDNGWGRGTRPVINIYWKDAVAYCNWLSEKNNLPKAYDGNGNLLDASGNETTDITKVVGYRLLTEAEWEYAARGGNESMGYKYSGSNTASDVAWYSENSGGKTHEVGTKLPNELGIYDMSGNVWEWCSDWYSSNYYSTSPSINPYNHTSSSRRVERCSGWREGIGGVKVSNRYGESPSTYRYSDLGFRVARTATASSSAESMPTARSWLAAVNIGNKIMAIGGGDRITKTPYANNEIYNPITNSWEIHTPMPTPRYALAAAEYNGKIYVFGGQQIFGNASPVNNVEIYDPVTDSWTTGSPMPNARCELAAATCGGKIYVIAGLNYATRYNTLQIYSPGTDSWSTGASLPKSFSQHAAVGYGGKVYVFGGMDNSRKRLDTVYIYDPQSDSWSSGTSAPTARSEIAAAVVGGKIYIFGGITKDFTEGLTTVDIYDPLSDSWQKGDPSLSKRSALAAASVGSKAYLIGGYLYGNPVIELNSVEAYSTE